LLTRTDVAAACFAVTLHATLGLLGFGKPVTVRKHSLIEVDVRKRVPPEPPQLTPPKPQLPEPKPKLRVARDVVTPPPLPSRALPPPTQTPPTPVMPIFGVSMDSTTSGPSDMSVAVGNTTLADPSRRAKPTTPVAPLSGSPSGSGHELRPVSVLSVKTLPDVDAEACGRAITYPKAALDLGIEGAVKLRVTLDEHGKVVAVALLSGLGHGLDQQAIDAIKHRCKFSAAIASDGSAVPFVIDPYVFHFEIPR
jgi:protein TonB